MVAGLRPLISTEAGWGPAAVRATPVAVAVAALEIVSVFAAALTAVIVVPTGMPVPAIASPTLKMPAVVVRLVIVWASSSVTPGPFSTRSPLPLMRVAILPSGVGALAQGLEAQSASPYSKRYLVAAPTGSIDVSNITELVVTWEKLVLRISGEPPRALAA